MSNISKKVNMVPVPDHLLDQVMSFMSQLDVQETDDIVMTSNEPKLGVDWVNENNCNCENKIAEYLEGKGVRTHYILCRVSTKEQARENSTSLQGQEQELRAAIADIVPTQHSPLRIRVSNIRGSAYKSIPAIMKRIGKAARAGDSIWVWRVDRLSRNIVQYLSWLEDLNNRGVEIYAKSEKLHYRANKIAFIQAILDAQKESAAIGERVKLAYKRKRARGDERVGSLPYGKRYRNILAANGKKIIRKVVENNPAEISILNTIKQAKNKELPNITANKLNRSRKFKKGKRWTASMVKRYQNK